MEKSLFEVSTRKKLRFDSSKGLLSVEGLWDLPLTSKSGASLDQVAIAINRQVKEYQEESFVTKPNAGVSELTVKLDIVKHIISVKMEENEKRLQAVEVKAKKEQLMGLIETKKAQELVSKPIEELEAKLKALG